VSDDGLFVIIENLKTDVDELQELVGMVSVETQIDAALDDLIDKSELQDILNLILND
jgi:hypothetical protein